MGLGKSLVLADHEEFSLFLRNLHHFLAVGEGHGHGFLTENVLAGFQGLDGKLGMGIVGCTHGDRIDFGIRQQFLRRVIDPAAVFRRHVLGTGFGRVKETYQLTVGICGIFRNVPNLGNLAAA